MKKDFTLFSYYFFFVNRVKIFRGTKKMLRMENQCTGISFTAFVMFLLKISSKCVFDQCMHAHKYIY